MRFRVAAVKIIFFCFLVLFAAGDCPGAMNSNASDLPAGITAERIFGHSVISQKLKENETLSGLDSVARAKVSFLVTGAVNQPGQYDLSGQVNVLEALLAAGGPSTVGSMRKIEVFHEETLLGKFDLYQFFHSGRLSNDFVFNGGELIKVAERGPLVAISGCVREVAAFELLPDELNVSRLVEIAGGLTKELEHFRVEIWRPEGRVNRLLYHNDAATMASLSEYQIQNGDSVAVLESFQDRELTFSIDGHVAEPGNKQFNPGMKLSDVLINLVHFKDGAALDYAELLRIPGRSKEYLMYDFSPAELLTGNTRSDLPLQPGDHVVFFPSSFLRRSNMVSVSGAVNYAGHKKFVSGMTVSKLILAGGGLNGRPETALLSRRSIRSGKLVVTNFSVNVKLAMAGDERQNLQLQPFDLLHIP